MILQCCFAAAEFIADVYVNIDANSCLMQLFSDLIRNLPIQFQTKQ